MTSVEYLKKSIVQLLSTVAGLLYRHGQLEKRVKLLEDKMKNVDAYETLPKITLWDVVARIKDTNTNWLYVVGFPHQWDFTYETAIPFLREETGKDVYLDYDSAVGDLRISVLRW